MKTQTKIASILTLTLIAAALLALALVTQANTAAAQRTDRAVSNLRLDHNDSDHLLINWDAPSSSIESPKDYRVIWAESGENYKTWTDETGNAFPTGASHTVTGLERGEEYKVKVRARYNNGSGPWSDEVRHTIPAAAPPPSPTATANPVPTATPEPEDATPDPPYNEGTSEPTVTGWIDWSDVEGAAGYDLEQNVPQNGYDNWVDITRPSDVTGTRAFVHGTAAIIVEPHAGPVHLRVRATFSDGTHTDWYPISTTTSE